MLRKTIILICMCVVFVGVAVRVGNLVYRMSGGEEADNRLRDAEAIRHLNEINNQFGPSAGEKGTLDKLRLSGKAARPAAQAFLKTIQSGRTAAAYSMTSDAFRERIDEKAFAELLERHPALSRPQDDGGGFNESNNGQFSHHIGFQEMVDGVASNTFTLIVIPEMGGYRVDGIRFEGDR